MPKQGIQWLLYTPSQWLNTRVENLGLLNRVFNDYFTLQWFTPSELTERVATLDPHFFEEWDVSIK